MDSGKGILLFGLLGLGLLFLLTRGRGGYSEEAEHSGESIGIPLKPVSRNAHHYSNEETWDIEWNEDGLPKRVVIHRNAVST